VFLAEISNTKVFATRVAVWTTLNHHRRPSNFAPFLSGTVGKVEVLEVTEWAEGLEGVDMVLAGVEAVVEVPEAVVEIPEADSNTESETERKAEAEAEAGWEAVCLSAVSNNGGGEVGGWEL